MSEHRSTKLASSSSGVYRGMLVVAEALPSEPQKGQKKEVFDDVTECWADAWVFRLRARPQHRCLSSRYCLRYIYSLCPSLEASKSWVPGVGAKGLCCAGERSGPSILVPERISECADAQRAARTKETFGIRAPGSLYLRVGNR